MAQYIDKSALVAEIDDRRDKIWKGIFIIPLEGRQRADAAFEYEILGKVRDFIDTIEVKEVDLEKSISDWLFEEGLPNEEGLIDYIKETAEHFFELGLSVSNSTKVTTPDIDDVLKENGVNPDSKEAKIIKESYFMAIERLAQKGEEV